MWDFDVLPPSFYIALSLALSHDRISLYLSLSCSLNNNSNHRHGGPLLNHHCPRHRRSLEALATAEGASRNNPGAGSLGRKGKEEDGGGDKALGPPEKFSAGGR